MFTSNGKNFVDFMSIFVPKSAFGARLRVEQKLNVFLIFQESDILRGARRGASVSTNPREFEFLRPMAGFA